METDMEASEMFLMEKVHRVGYKRRILPPTGASSPYEPLSDDVFDCKNGNLHHHTAEEFLNGGFFRIMST